MTLLQDLSNLDLSAVVNARASISTSSGDLNVSLGNGAATAVLGDLGTAIQAIENGIENPEELLNPLLEALLELAEPLKGEIPVGPWFDAVQTGIRLLLEIIEAINGDPKNLAAFVSNTSSDDLIKKANKLVSEYSPVSLGGLTQFRQLVELVEGNMPNDPGELAELAIRILQPFEGRQFRELRTSVDALLSASIDLNLPNTRLTGLTASLQAVIQAANTGEVVALESALQNLQRIRSNTLNVLRNDIAQINTRIGRLPVEQLFTPMNEVGQVLQTAEDGVLEFLETWRREIVAANQFIETADFSQVSNLLNTGLDHVEAVATQLFVDPIDAAVEQLKQWLRGLLAHLHLVENRNEITQFLAKIADEIDAANIDGIAKDAKKVLNDIEQAISGDLVGSVQAEVGALKDGIDAFLDNVIGSLETITLEINNVASEAGDILNRIEGVLNGFKQTIDQITASIDQIGIEAATAQVTDTLTDLRQTAEEVLKNVALPDALRPVIEQLISEIENIDLDVVFEPAFQVAEMDLSIPAEVTDGLDQAAEAIKNLIPDELITEIEAQVSGLLDVIRDFDPAALLSGVTDTINDASNAIRGLDPRPAVNEIRGPYQEILDLLDEIHPNRLLAPVIETWDGILGEVNLQSPGDAINSLSSGINSAGEQLAQQAVSPIVQMAPEGMLEMPDASDGSGSSATASSNLNPEDILPVKPGDVIRMFGYLPNKLREFISQLEDTVAEEFLSRLNALGQGLSTDLRSIPDQIMAVENRLLSVWDEMLLPIGPLQFEAQLTIEANFTTDQIEMDVSLQGVASVRPGQLRSELDQTLNDTSNQIHQISAQLTSSAGNNMMYAIDQLEKNLLHGLTQDLDDFLAALDPEPIALELDKLIEIVLRRAPEVLDDIQDDLITTARRFEKIIRDLNPATQAQKFLSVIEVLKEQVNLLDPHRLAAELTEIHQAIKQVFLAYDPAVFAEEIYDIVEALAETLEALDPAALLGDLADFDAVIQRVEDAVPTQALASIDSSLEEVGGRLQEIDLNGLMEAINDLPDRIIEAVRNAVEAIKAEILALLQAIKYASGNASVSVEASASVG